ncbi:hypothetical protein RSOLAG1IB_00243 [Rhizoctonia solani AG-1 IB]|uniref:Uncharacterized protein n=1 Tax=Thanatephorus cucumeris (strain AG1-IB / isolate 7/3/14) TaxID=1108050 RepID=A0A0B7F687_THACB|nr:hypothetical protein RSOLAG1IB_00243 [Rhizoctonia solani AG-1 IB]
MSSELSFYDDFTRIYSLYIFLPYISTMLLFFDLWNEIALILTTMALTTEHSATMIFQATTALISVVIGGSIDILLLLGEAILVLAIDLVVLLFDNLPIMMLLWVCLLSYQHFWVNRRATVQYCTCALRRNKSWA